jgi:hypothetical protein
MDTFTLDARATAATKLFGLCCVAVAPSCSIEITTNGVSIGTSEREQIRTRCAVNRDTPDLPTIIYTTGYHLVFQGLPHLHQQRLDDIAKDICEEEVAALLLDGGLLNS